MRTITSIEAMQQTARRARLQKKRIGFVPTMGYLHNGHRSLIKRCKKENDLTVLSIFVNPKQFAPTEDYRLYPRDKKKDELLAKKEKVDIIFYPSARKMYPTSYLTYVHTEQLTDVLCGRFRPGHFKGVTTVVAKLVNIVLPDCLYLGQKDAQQALVLSRMVTDLNFPLKMKILPTIREKDGLAVSSRNKYLTEQQRKEAPILYRALREAKKKVSAGEKKAGYIQKAIKEMIRKNSAGRIEYVACVDADTLRPLTALKGNVLIAMAVWFGRARLIDNIKFRVK